MDRPLKERLVGATVLVALMIVVVPLFLDGPAHHEADSGDTVSEAVSLPPVERPTHVISLDGDAPASTAPRVVENSTAEQPEPPAPAPRSTDQQSSADRPAPAVAAAPEREVPPRSTPRPPKPAEKPPATAPAPAPAPTKAEGWAVQVGSFKSEKSARGLAGSLRERDYSAFVARTTIDGQVLYRVRIGPERDRERAEALAQRLRADGQPTTIVRHP